MSALTSSKRAVALLAVQALLVLTIAGKYLYERKVCPRVWVKAAQYDPNTPLRGRYLALQLAVDACGLPMDEAHHREGYAPNDHGSYDWTVRLVAIDGKLTPVLATNSDHPETTYEVSIGSNGPCNRAVLSDGLEFFIPDIAKGSFPLAKGQQLWVEVTVPPMGSPRPIQLAISDSGVFRPLYLQ